MHSSPELGIHAPNSTTLHTRLRQLSSFKRRIEHLVVGCAASVWKWLGLLAALCSSLGWALISDLLSVAHVAICLILLTFVVALIRALEPRYKLHPSAEVSVVPVRSTIFSPSSGDKPFIKILQDTVRSRQLDASALDKDEIQRLLQSLSLNYTDAEFERVDWLNTTMKSLWQPARALLNKFLINDLLKPKKGIVDRLEGKNLQSDRPKLSHFLSVCRKLNELRKAEVAYRRNRTWLGQRVLNTCVMTVKLVIVYVKRFLTDYILYLFDRSSEQTRQKEKRMQYSLDQLLRGDLIKKLVDKYNQDLTKPASCPIPNSRRDKSSHAKKVTSAPVGQTIRKTNQKKQVAFAIDRTRKRGKLASAINRAYRKVAEQDVTFERIRLGDSVPQITGIKAIENSNKARHLINYDIDTGQNAHDDEGSMRFITELAYATDDIFSIKMSSVPLIGKFDLRSIRVSLKLLIVINHTKTEFNKDLKIFETPDEILFPSINYIQINLLDVPQIDWRLRNQKVGLTYDSSNGMIYNWLSHILNSINLISLFNSDFVKYVMHTTLRLALRWLHPFDVRVGPHILFKTTCR